MKRILPLLLILTALAACTESMRHGKALKEAEALLSSRPETALRMLDSIGREGDGMGKAERMRWQLLRLTAQNKCYVPFTSDSAAREVADYYDRHGSPNERMAAHYQLGCAYRDMGKPQLQLQAFHKAIESADTTDADCDLWTLSRVYSQMAELFYIHLMPIQEKEALNKAYRYTLQAGDTLAATYELQQMSWVYDRLDQPDSVVYYSKKGYELFSQFGKKTEAAQSLGMAIHAELLKGDFEEAARQLAIYEGESGRFDSLHEVAAGHELYYHDKGFYYLGTGRADSAAACPWSNKMFATPWVSEYVNNAMLATQWHQFWPYNKYCFTSNGLQAVVGCVPLAMGQIMARHQHPSSYNNRTIQWPLFSYTTAPYGPHGEDDAAWLLHEIGLLIGVTYGVNSTTVDSANASFGFQTLGYSYTYTAELPDTAAIINDLRKGNPIFMAGTSTNSNNFVKNSHAWVIDGCLTNSRTKRVYGNDNYTYTTYYDKEFLVHCNWGWRDNGHGNSNGYFNYGVFQVRDYYFYKYWKCYHNIEPIHT